MQNKWVVEMQTMTYNPPTAQVTAQKDVTYGNVQPNTKSKKKEPSKEKTEVIINPSKKDCQETRTMRFSEYSTLHERGDFWHPDPEKDRKLGGPGANQRAREDRDAASKPKEDPKKLRPGESYYDYAKRRQRGESYVPGKPAEKLGAVTSIPQSERDAAKARLLAKTKAIRDKKKIQEKIDVGADAGATISDFVHSKDSRFAGDSKKQRIKRALGAYYGAKKEEFEIEEGMTLKDFKANRRKLKRKEASDDAKKRGHVGKEWYNSGRKYGTDEAKSRRAKMSDDQRAARHRAAVDPDDDRDENTYSADKTKNPKKLRKQKAMGESLSFSDFMEARRMDREGADRGDAGREQRAAKAKASLAAKAKRDAAIDKYEKSSGRTVDRSKSVEYKAHAKNHPGSRQEPKVKGAKETPAETHSRRVNRQVARVVKHGHTSKERKEAEAMSKHTSRFD